eukprot:3221789-Pleurochrysis_carterae.AAC.2
MLPGTDLDLNPRHKPSVSANSFLLSACRTAGPCSTPLSTSTRTATASSLSRRGLRTDPPLPLCLPLPLCFAASASLLRPPSLPLHPGLLVLPPGRLVHARSRCARRRGSNAAMPFTRPSHERAHRPSHGLTRLLQPFTVRLVPNATCALRSAPRHARAHLDASPRLPSHLVTRAWAILIGPFTAVSRERLRIAKTTQRVSAAPPCLAALSLLLREGSHPFPPKHTRTPFRRFNEHRELRDRTQCTRAPPSPGAACFFAAWPPIALRWQAPPSSISQRRSFSLRMRLSSCGGCISIPSLDLLR